MCSYCSFQVKVKLTEYNVVLCQVAGEPHIKSHWYKHITVYILTLRLLMTGFLHLDNEEMRVKSKFSELICMKKFQSETFISRINYFINKCSFMFFMYKLLYHQYPQHQTIYTVLLIKVLLDRYASADCKEHHAVVMVQKSSLMSKTVQQCASHSMECKISCIQHLSCKHFSSTRAMTKFK